MPQRNGAAVHIQLLAIHVQLAVAGYHLRRKSFVQLDNIKLLQLCAMPLFQQAHCRHRTNAHGSWIHPRLGPSHDSRQRLKIVFFREVLTGQHHRRGAVSDAGRIPRGDGSCFGEYRLELGHLLQRDAEERMLVFGKSCRALFALDHHRRNLVLEPASLQRRLRSLL